MRIGMVTACYKPVVNGVTRMVSLYKSHLEALGHDVYVFTLGDPDPAGDEPGVIRSPALPLKVDGYYFSVRYSAEAQTLLRQMDVLHCHHLFMGVEMAHRYGRCPIVYTNHTRYDLYSGAYLPLPQPAADALMRQIWPEFTDLADVVVTPSESVRRVMLDFGVRGPIEVIENGVDLEPFRAPACPLAKCDLNMAETAVLAIYVGRLSPEKNLPCLLRQFAIAADAVPALHLMLLGDGRLEQELRQLARDRHIAGRVHFLGAVDYAAVPDYLAAADFFVTASVSEVHPLAIIEAMAAGLPVAAPAAPGIVDTVTADESGLLALEPDRGLAATMVGLALNDERRRRMGAAAQTASERYNIHNTIARTLDLYRRLRDTRPDLQRSREHGRWVKQRERLQPLLDQLVRLLRPSEKPQAGSLRKVMAETAERGHLL